MTDKRKLGLERLSDILGKNAESALEKFENISPDFAKYIVEFVYGDVYARKGLSDKDREIALVSNMMGQGQLGFPFKTHVKGMLNVGWTKQEILELIIFLSFASGFPTAVEAIFLAQEVFEEVVSEIP